MRKNLFDWVTDAADLISEVSPGVSIVELAGDHRLLIENHRGVAMYGRREIRIRVSFGMICVCGTCLELSRMSRQQLIITGRLEGISLIRGECP